MPAVTGIAHVEFSVSNLDCSSAWWCSLLGATEVFREENNQRYQIRDAAIREPVSGLVLAFTEHRIQEGGPFTPHRVGLDHISFGINSAADLAAWAEHLRGLGISFDETAHGFADVITCADPDGIAIEFFLPRRRTPSPGA